VALAAPGCPSPESSRDRCACVTTIYLCERDGRGLRGLPGPAGRRRLRVRTLAHPRGCARPRPPV